MKKFKIAIGSDHAGYDKKEVLIQSLKKQGHAIKDFGTFSKDSVDYPDFAHAVANSVRRNTCDRGVLICGTGIGMSIAANKVPGIRAALACRPEQARFAASHNYANIICLAGRGSRVSHLKKMVKIWISTPFEGNRHKRRVGKILQLEKKYTKKKS